MSTPLRSIGQCPVCGQGLLGIRVCDGSSVRPVPHGLVVCDECEATWTSPDADSPHSYPSPEDGRCPVCLADLWEGSRWADDTGVESLGWGSAVEPSLNFDP